MIPLEVPGDATTTSRVVLIGAHCDDLAIGAGGLLLGLNAIRPGWRVSALVATGDEVRAAEERAALSAFLPDATIDLRLLGLPDGRLPAHWDTVKDALQELAAAVAADGGADLVLAPRSDDAHQDHALLGSMAPTAFRDHLLLGYEIIKYDGDLGRPNLYAPLRPEDAERKWELLERHYPSQHAHDWFDRESILGLARVRGVECHARYAEAFTTTKAVLRLR